jgi:hypothetical protein
MGCSLDRADWFNHGDDVFDAGLSRLRRYAERQFRTMAAGAFQEQALGIALNDATRPFVLALADKGVFRAPREDMPAFATGSIYMREN